MLTTKCSGDRLLITADADALLLIVGSMREAMEALDDDEFSVRTGFTREEARATHDVLLGAFREWKRQPKTR